MNGNRVMDYVLSLMVLVEILSCYFPFIMLFSGLKMSEYEAYQLTYFPQINS